MIEERIQEAVEEKLNPETFDVLDYLEEQPIAEKEVVIFTDVKLTRRMAELLEKRTELLAARKEQLAKDGSLDLAITEDLMDTEFDDEINAILPELQKTALTFVIQTIAPKLIRAMEKASQAKADKTWSAERRDQHTNDAMYDILARAIREVRLGNGSVDPKPWDGERLKAFEEKVYPQQATHLVAELYELVYTGRVFDDALTVDF